MHKCVHICTSYEAVLVHILFYDWGECSHIVKEGKRAENTNKFDLQNEYFLNDTIKIAEIIKTYLHRPLILSKLPSKVKRN